mmetsp:Transcript_51411/g.160443  ORF Transcript_51411/g.160443 Transcript_51411/m.160443 type:complete len:158 (+) Transcript_51411:373-846(+)
MQGWSEMTILNTVIAFFSLFVVYDFFYCIWHRILHVRGLYKFIHKHHHHQAAPSRGNADAVNVHPIEFIVGEYCHLLAIFIIPCHAVVAAVFVVLGGILASLNHTRYDIAVPLLFDTKAHDQHHVIPTVNYGQYTMLWDRVFGTYVPHPLSSRPKAE